VNKAFRHIFLGLKGIAINPKLSLTKKIFLYIDYCRLSFFAFTQYRNSRLSDSSIDKTFFISALNIKIHFPNVYSFFFLFNEIFCKAEYPAENGITTYIDLGAHIGLAILWYHYFNPRVKIYCFEPDPITYEYLKKNLDENGIINAIVYKKAVSLRRGKAKFYSITDNIQQLDSGLQLNQNLPYTIRIVEKQKLSTILKRVKKIDLIKMDIEGSEYDVLQDLFSTKSITKVQKIVFESHIFNSKERHRYNKFVKKLKAIGSFSSSANSKYSYINYWQKN